MMFIILGFFSFIFFGLLIFWVGYVVSVFFKILHLLIINQSFIKKHSISTDKAD
ncbi:Uncharacterised protein [Serratia quinivorans]|uniref:Uncharacterized protein n=1 Tax=Serratia quinivorans TaxID=137545 RepID=A0A380D9C9_9GAMM|nr:Uncharacterised protein [Serratia quinivorans]SUJ86184.1 Uncharacterised protein [Serratia quinivorans]